MAGRIGGGSYFPQGYLPESERNSATGVRTHYDPAVHRFNHYTTSPPPLSMSETEQTV